MSIGKSPHDVVDDILTCSEDITASERRRLEEKNWYPFLGADFGLPIVMLLLLGYQILFRLAEETLKIDGLKDSRKMRF